MDIVIPSLSLVACLLDCVSVARCCERAWQDSCCRVRRERRIGHGAVTPLGLSLPFSRHITGHVTRWTCALLCLRADKPNRGTEKGGGSRNERARAANDLDFPSPHARAE